MPDENIEDRKTLPAILEPEKPEKSVSYAPGHPDAPEPEVVIVPTLEQKALEAVRALREVFAHLDGKPIADNPRPADRPAEIGDIMSSTKLHPSDVE